MRIALTGSEGWIGSRLKIELEKNGHEVFGADILDPNNPMDLLEEDVFRNWVEEIKPDLCYHLAAAVGRLACEKDIVNTARNNAELTTIIAKVCGELGIRLAYVSTSEIYGDHAEHECDEYDELKIPSNFYGLSKRWGEEAAEMYAPDKLVIARPNMPYGPGVPPGWGRRALDNMLWLANHRLPIIVHEGAERSWCWIDDVVVGLRMIIEQPESGTFNIGRDDDRRSMLEIAEMACNITGASKDIIQQVPAPKLQTAVKRLSSKRLQQLGWNPTVELEEGFPKVYEWVRKFDIDSVEKP
jgi:nucleoside-diphosphate-sugar epimerase